MAPTRIAARSQPSYARDTNESQAPPDPRPPPPSRVCPAAAAASGRHDERAWGGAYRAAGPVSRALPAGGNQGTSTFARLALPECAKETPKKARHCSRKALHVQPPEEKKVRTGASMLRMLVGPL
eukprot:5796935-Pleurochrysis_carterae.AAC.1